jgi:hypothetical protein
MPRLKEPLLFQNKYQQRPLRGRGIGHNCGKHAAPHLEK